jgi:Tfp pilus assembly protein PilN
MLDINLLPKEYRKFDFAGYIRDYFQVIGIVFAVVVMGNALIVTLGANSVFALQNAERGWKEREKKSAELTALSQQVSTLQTKVKALKQYAGKDESVSEMLYDVYKDLPMNMWLTSLEYTGKALTLKGASLDMDKDASLTVKDYVEKLNASPSAARMGGEYKVGDLVRETLGDKSIVRFVVVFEAKAAA